MYFLYIYLISFINIGPQGGLISQIEISPNTKNIYAGLGIGGFYLSEDHGNTWESLISYPYELYFKEFTILKSNPFVPDSVFYLIAKGDNDKYFLYIIWNQTNWSSPNIPVQDSFKPPIGIAAKQNILWGFEDFIYKTNPFGNYQSTLDPPGDTSYELVNFGDTVVLSTNQGAFISYDFGNNWNSLFSYAAVNAASLLPQNPDTVDAVVSVPYHRVYYRVNNNWRPSNLIGSYVKKFYLHNNVLLAVEGTRIWRSFDHGKNFEYVPIPDTLNFFVNDVGSISDTLILATSGGVLVSYDNGNNYYIRNGNMKKFVIFNIDINPFIKKNIIVSTFGAGPVRINNFGFEYRINNRGISIPYVWKSIFHPYSPETLYTINAIENKIYRFSNGIWNELPLNSPEPISFIRIHPENSLKNFYYAGTKDGIYISKDYGNSWIKRLPNKIIIDLKFLPVKGDTVPIIAGTYMDGFFMSVDTGFTFFHLLNFPKDSNLASFDINPVNRNEIYVLSATGKLYRSIDGGNAWDTLIIPHSPSTFMFSSIKLLPSNKGIFYVSQLGVDGLYQFFEGGDTFFYFIRNIYPPPIINIEFSKIQPSGGILYAGSFEGAWYMIDTTININFNILDDTILTPEGDGVNDSIRFRINIFDSANIGKKEIHIFDTLGNTCIKAVYPPSEFNFNRIFSYFGYDSTGRQVPPGKYICQLKAYDGFTNEKTLEIPFYINYIPLQTKNSDAFLNFNQRKIANNHNITYMVYTSWGNNSEVYYTLKRGLIWHYPLNVSNTFNKKSYLPSISVRNKTAIVYIEPESNLPLRINIYKKDSLLVSIPIARQRDCADPFILEDDFGDFHVVWSEKSANIFNRIFYMKIRNDGGIIIFPTEIVNIPSADLHSLYLCEDSLANLYFFFCNFINNKIYYKKGDLNGNWDEEVILFDGIFPQAISDNVSRIYLFRIFNLNLYFNLMEMGNWGSDYKVNSSQIVKGYTSSIDSFGNLYVIFESIDSSLYLRIRDNIGNWTDIEYIGKGNFPQMPEKFNGYFYALKLDTIPYLIKERSLNFYGDTIPPSFTFNFNPPELIVGDVDTVRIYSSEPLKTLPQFYIIKNDSFISLNINEDAATSNPLDYISYFDSKGYDIGKVVFEIRGIDLAGNLGIKRETLILRKAGEFIPESKFAIYPNPARNTNEVFISYYINENADIEIKIYTITGRLLKTIKGYGKGGMRNEIIWNFDNKVNSGLYILVFEARGKNSGEFKRIIKRVGVIR